jgi:hypothetical protein
MLRGVSYVDGVLDCQLDLLGSNTQLHTITAESLRTLPITNSSAENSLNSFVPFRLSLATNSLTD